MFFVMSSECHMIAVGCKNINISASQLYKSPVNFCTTKGTFREYIPFRSEQNVLSVLFPTYRYAHTHNLKKIFTVIGIENQQPPKP
jgi:hypothetical protein